MWRKLIGDAQRLNDHAFGGLASHPAPIQPELIERMITADLGDPAAREMKDRTVADIEDRGLAGAAFRRPNACDGRTTGPLVVGACFSEHPAMHRGQHLANDVLLINSGCVSQGGYEKLHRAPAGPGAIALPAHTV